MKTQVCSGQRQSSIDRLSSRAFLFSFLLMAVAGCKSSSDRAATATSGTATVGSSGHLVIFSNELQSGGGAFLYPHDENQTLSFADMSNPISAHSIRYVWNGGDVLNQGVQQHVFAGFDLMNVASLNAYSSPSNTGRDLHASGYGHVTFYARGSLSTNTLVKIEVAEPSVIPGPCIDLSTDGTLEDAASAPNNCGITGVLHSDWASYSIPISASQVTHVKDFFKATFIFIGSPGAPGGGGTVYFDDIEYVP